MGEGELRERERERESLLSKISCFVCLQLNQHFNLNFPPPFLKNMSVRPCVSDFSSVTAKKSYILAYNSEARAVREVGISQVSAS